MSDNPRVCWPIEELHHGMLTCFAPAAGNTADKLYKYVVPVSYCCVMLRSVIFNNHKLRLSVSPPARSGTSQPGVSIPVHLP
jgi:hypothetical protein